MTALLPTGRIAPLDEASRGAFTAACEAAIVLFRAGTRLPPDASARILAVSGEVFQRWGLHVILVVRAAGEQGIGYGGISRALGGLPSGSLSPKLKDLVDRGVIEREDVDEEDRTRYRLAREARAFGDAVYLVTHAKAYQHTIVQAGGTTPEVGAFSDALNPGHPAIPFADALDAFRAAASAYAQHHASRPAVGGHESALETATRFTQTCGRKWDAPVMMALLARPAGFAALASSLPIGDQALSKTLRELLETHTISRDRDGTYRLAPFGLFDFCFGFGTLCLYLESRGSTFSA